MHFDCILIACGNSQHPDRVLGIDYARPVGHFKVVPGACPVPCILCRGWLGLGRGVEYGVLDTNYSETDETLKMKSLDSKAHQADTVVNIVCWTEYSGYSHNRNLRDRHYSPTKKTKKTA